MASVSAQSVMAGLIALLYLVWSKLKQDSPRQEPTRTRPGWIDSRPRQGVTGMFVRPLAAPDSVLLA